MHVKMLFLSKVPLYEYAHIKLVLTVALTYTSQWTNYCEEGAGVVLNGGTKECLCFSSIGIEWGPLTEVSYGLGDLTLLVNRHTFPEYSSIFIQTKAIVLWRIPCESCQYL